MTITDGIVKYMRSKAGPSSRELKSVAEVEKFLENFDISLVGKWFGSSIRNKHDCNN